MDKKTFIENVNEGRAQVDALLAQIDPSLMLQPGAAGEMSIKDLVAHITWYEREMAIVMATRNLAGSEFWEMPLDPRNHAIFEANRERSLNEVLEEAREVHRKLLTELDKLSDEDLVNPASVQNMPGEWIPWKVIASNTFGHYQEHLGDLQAWVEAHSGHAGAPA